MASSADTEPIYEHAGVPDMIQSPLLALPSELRQLILEELLYRPKCDHMLPRFLEDAPPVHPQILRTCKQLHLEGSELLYNSTVHFEVRRRSRSSLCVPCGEDPYGLHVVYLGRFFSPNRLPVAVRDSTSKVNIQIWAHRADGVYRIDRLQEHVREAAKVIKQVPNWQVFQLRAYTFLGTPLDDADGRTPPNLQAVLPLIHLRNRTEMVCDGVDPEFAERLCQTVKSNERGIDLDEAYDDFYRLMLSTLPPPLPPGGRRTESDFLPIRGVQEGEQLRDSLRQGCRIARNYGDIVKFVSERKRLARKLRDILIEREQTFSLPITLPDPTAVLAELDAILQEHT